MWDRHWRRAMSANQAPAAQILRDCASTWITQISVAATLSVMRQISPKALRDRLEEPGLVIVDVRDDDRFGGHIKSSINVPSQHFAARCSDLIEQTKDAQTVVFHCQLSQQRGPSCAKYYSNHLNADSPQVYVLQGGFQDWAGLYGKDSSVTESFVADLYI